ncbi:MAG: 3-deoxy-D-manno-octulosonic acid transferase [Flavimaricola sp.]|nr:3-deoxy-D-manno-octulosonic acid transferase [Flavimaricola sp.]
MTSPAPSSRATLVLSAYAALANLSVPLLARRITARLTDQGISPKRAAERMGRATLPRPAGPLAWFHAASVGESLSILPLLTMMQAARPDLRILLTSGTASSAQIMADRLPPGALHQFAPLDSRVVLDRFLSHWKPDLAVLVESELWPQMICRTDGKGIPLVLLNARLSRGSLRNWARFGRTAQALFGRFRLIVTQTDETAEALGELTNQQGRIRTGGNMKAAAPPPPADAKVLEDLRQSLGAAPCWLAASTHPGEEALILQAHKRLMANWPELRLILVPRHPERADKVAGMIVDAGLGLTRRSLGQGPTAQVYLADTLGEMGLWLRLAPITFMGGSLTPNGGHNPWEGAALGTALLTGPYVENAATDYASLSAAEAVITVTDETLGATLHDLLQHPDRARTLGQNAKKAQTANGTALGITAQSLLSLLPAKDRP